MDDPFFGRWWDRFPQRSSQRSPYSSHPYSAANVTPTKPEYAYRGAPKIKPRTFTVPVQGPPDHPSPNSSTVTKESSPTKRKSKNVISIPINTEAPKSSSGIKKAAAPRMDETSAAIKMQSVFRGFSARKGAPLKNLRVIREVKAEAETIRRRLADRQVVELILQKEKERLKMSEGIMSLLLKLDAIQGVNSFVRESRKAAIRELFKLEETVDAIIAGKFIQETVSMAAQAAEDDNHGKEMVASGEENGEGQCSERGSNEEEVKDEVLDGSKLTSANDSEMLERDPNEKEIEAETIQADEQQRECEGMDYEEPGEVIEAGAGENARVEEDVVKVKEENERLKKMVVDMFKKNEFQNEMITNLSLKIAQLEEQISKSKRKKTEDKTKKMKESSNDSNSGRSKTE